MKQKSILFCGNARKKLEVRVCVMSKHELGADRVLHEGAGYRDKYKIKSKKPPVGSRENPSNPKQEGTDAVFIPATAKWMKK